LAARNVEVGRQMSVIAGNNDQALVAVLNPRLTTFDIHAELLGRVAVRRLAARLRGGQDEPDVELVIPATLVEGESVASRTEGPAA
jgi:DNA-binding LacI/PurR family transcriptional regulator